MFVPERMRSVCGGQDRARWEVLPMGLVCLLLMFALLMIG